MSAKGLTLQLSPKLAMMPGCGFGLDQSVMLGTIDVKLPPKFDFAAIEPLLEEFALAPVDVPAAVEEGPEAGLVRRIHLWHAAIQRGANVPVFGGCRLWDRGATEAGARRIAFAVPGFAVPATKAALQFAIEAVAELAPSGANAAKALPGLRERFKALWAVLLKHTMQGANSFNFVETAHRLGIEHRPMFGRMWAYGLGRHRKLLNSSVTSATPHFSVGFARDKLTCGALLRAAGLPVAPHGHVKDVEAAVKTAQRIGYPVVVKPADADAGAGVTAGITDEADLRRAFAVAAETSDRVMVEKHEDGAEYRVTVLHGRVVRAWVRRPGGVVGDGEHTVAELMERFNREPRNRLAELFKGYPVLALDDEVRTMIAGQGFTAESVIPDGQFVPLRRRANISAGGTYVLIDPATLHPDNRALAESAAVTLGLDIAGVDIISGGPETSWRETGGIVCEVNASPQLGYGHSEPIYGRILTEVLGGKGSIPVHLIVVQPGFALPKPVPDLAAAGGCNAAAWDTSAWVEGAGTLGPFGDVFRAGSAILLDTRVTGALVVMTEPEALRLGLPAARFASIRLAGKPGWKPAPLLAQLLAGHSRRIVRVDPATSARAAVA